MYCITYFELVLPGWEPWHTRAVLTLSALMPAACTSERRRTFFLGPSTAFPFPFACLQSQPQPCRITCKICELYRCLPGNPQTSYADHTASIALNYCKSSSSGAFPYLTRTMAVSCLNWSWLPRLWSCPVYASSTWKRSSKACSSMTHRSCQVKISIPEKFDINWFLEAGAHQIMCLKYWQNSIPYQWLCAPEGIDVGRWEIKNTLGVGLPAWACPLCVVRWAGNCQEGQAVLS